MGAKPSNSRCAAAAHAVTCGDSGGNGVLHGGNQLGVQLLAGIIIFLWVGGLSTAIFLPLKFLRLGDDFQDVGADLMEHSPAKAYSDNKEEAKAGEPNTFDL